MYWLNCFALVILVVSVFTERLGTIQEENEDEYETRNLNRVIPTSFHNRNGRKYTFDRWSKFPRRNHLQKPETVMTAPLGDKKARSKRSMEELEGSIKAWWEKNRRSILLGHAFAGQEFGIPGK